MSEIPLNFLRQQSEEEKDLQDGGFVNIYDSSEKDDHSAMLARGNTAINEKNKELILKCKKEELSKLKLFCMKCWRISSNIDSEKFDSNPLKCWEDFSNLEYKGVTPNSEKAIINGMRATVASGFHVEFKCPVCQYGNPVSFEASEIPQLA